MKYLPKIKNKKSLLIALGLSLTILTAYKIHSVRAQEFIRTFTVIPPTIEQRLNPGDKAEGIMKIVNDSPNPLTFSVSVQDYTVLDTHGTPNLLPPNTLGKRFSASAWLGVSPDTFTIEPQTRQELHYYLQTPPDAAPGGHYAAVVFTPVNPDTEEGTGASVNAQIGTLFYITISGPITEQAQVSRFYVNGLQESGPIKVQTQIRNMGDLHIRPDGSITISGGLGTFTQKLEPTNIFPTAARDFENTLGRRLMIGRYKAVLLASYGQDNNLPLSAVVYFWVFPWRIAIVIVLLVVASILWVRYSKKRKKDSDDKPEETKKTESEAKVEEKTS